MGEWLNDWSKKMWAGLLHVLSGAPALELLDKLTSWFNGLWSALTFESIKQIWGVFSDELPELYQDSVATLATLLAWQLETVTGLNIPEDQLLAAIDGIPDDNDRVALGRVLADPFLAIFDVDAVAAGYRARQPGEAQLNNLRRFMGANLRLQVGGMALNTVSSVLPFNLPNALNDIPDKIDRVLGWEDLMEEVIQEPLQALVSDGLKIQYLRLTKPIDYDFTEVMRLHHAGVVSRDVVHQVLDNLGYRDDIRDHLIADSEADLTEGNVRDLYEQRIVDKDFVDKYFRAKGHGVESGKLKTMGVVDARLWDALGKIDDQYLSLYRDCVISRGELQSWLQGRGWTNQEQDAAIALEELKRRQRKMLSDSDLSKALERGLLSATEVHDAFVCQGLTDVDATIKLILLLEKSIPDDCWDKIGLGDLQGAIRGILALIGIGGITSLPAGLLKLLECWLQTPASQLEEQRSREPEPSVKLPTGSISALPSTATVGDPFRLVWSFANATRVQITPEIGDVAPQGTLFLTAAQNQVWRALVDNEDGRREFQASILVKPKPEPKPVRAMPPSVSLTVTPARVIEGEQIAIQWATSNADQVFLDDGRGPQAVAESGARFGVADQSRIYTITASGPGGQRQRSDTVTVRPAPEERIPPPRASLTIIPGRATVGERVEVRWSTSNADRVVMDGVAGLVDVAPSGATVITAERDLIVELRAINVAESLQVIAQDALIVEQPAPPEERPDAPPTVSLTIRPSRTKRGETVALEWRTSRATRIVLQDATGTFELEPIGAETFMAERTETLILHAFGPGGEKAIAKVLVVE